MTTAKEMVCPYGVSRWEVQHDSRKVKVLDDYNEALEFAQSIIDFDDKRAAKVERYQGYADNAGKRATQRHQASRDATAGIPFGQPILVGHHSERRHRNAVDKSWANLGKAVEETKRSDHWQGRADAVEADTSIRSDDPLADNKLEDRIAELERKRTQIKSFNAARRKGTPIDEINATDELKEKFLGHVKYGMKPGAIDGKTGFPPYVLSNLGANIRRLEGRRRLVANGVSNYAVRTIAAKWDGECADCHEAIGKGDPISRLGPRRWVCGACRAKAL